MLTNCTLYPFQQDAVDRIVQRQQMLLAITMGGGKTVVSIAAVEEMLADDTIERALIVVPSMLKYQWQREIMRFTDRLALVIDGTPTQRALLWSIAHNYYYVIVNYEAVVNDADAVRALSFDCLIIDEASYIKSFRAKRSKAVKRLGKRAKVRLALTGQPVENRPEDLFSIMEFVDDTVLGRFDIFDRTFIVRDWYGRPQRYRNLKLLRQRMEEAMVRKSRKDIADQLPRVVETMIPVTISRAEAKLYNLISDQLLDKMYEAMNQFGSSFSLTANYGRDDNHVMMQAQGQIMSMMLALRLVCVDASLLLDSARRFLDPDRSDGSQYAADLFAAGLLDKIPESTKHKELVELLTTIMEEEPDSKVVVFSTFKGVLREIQKRTAHLSRSVIFDGDMSAKQKDAAKMTFQTDPGCRLFLSSDAGGYGVNLSEANYLISFDLPWSTGKFEQRESRIIRLSTEFEHVTLIDLVVRGSLEQRIHDMLTQKKGVADAFIDGGFDSKGRFEVTLSSLTAFLQENSP